MIKCFISGIIAALTVIYGPTIIEKQIDRNVKKDTKIEQKQPKEQATKEDSLSWKMFKYYMKLKKEYEEAAKASNE